MPPGMRSPLLSPAHPTGDGGLDFLSPAGAGGQMASLHMLSVAASARALASRPNVAKKSFIAFTNAIYMWAWVC